MNNLIGKKAPDFNASAVINGNKIVNNFTLNQFNDKYILLFFYPKDFTFVCPTELHAFQEKIQDFEERNVQLIAVSTDTEYSHLGWLNISKKNGGIQGITYPIISDINKIISYHYGVLAGECFFDSLNNFQVKGTLIAYRGQFLIDKNKIIRHQLVNDFPLGRNVNEALRLIDSLQHFEKYGEVCPANWNKGQVAMIPNHKGLLNYLDK